MNKYNRRSTRGKASGNQQGRGGAKPLDEERHWATIKTTGNTRCEQEQRFSRFSIPTHTRIHISTKPHLKKKILPRDNYTHVQPLLVKPTQGANNEHTSTLKKAT